MQLGAEQAVTIIIAPFPTLRLGDQHPNPRNSQGKQPAAGKGAEYTRLGNNLGKPLTFI